MKMESRVQVTVNLTVDQRIEIIKQIDKHFDILDFGINSFHDEKNQEEDLHKEIDIMYPGCPKTVNCFYVI
jgi:hypothetical protein